jgi:hypothetical protein
MDSRAISGDANILTREACMDAIHSASPLGWIKQPHVSLVHVQAGEPAVLGSLAQDGAGVGVPLDGADGLMSKNEVCEQTPPGSGE